MDNVNHPSHYRVGNFECIDIMCAIFGVKRVRIFCILNAFKYLFRFRFKNGIEDLKKARWYIDWYIEHSEEESEIK